MKFVKHTTNEVIEVYLLDDEGKILLTDSVPRLEDKASEDLLLQIQAGKMVKAAVKQNIIPVEEIDEVGVKTLNATSKKAELNEDFK